MQATGDQGSGVAPPAGALSVSVLRAPADGGGRILPLPRGPHRLTREMVLASQRGRILDALAHAVAEKGFAATTVADIVGGAGVSRATFYENFRHKEDCFLAAYQTGVDLILEHVAKAAAEPEDWREGLRAGMATYLAILASEPAFARTCMPEVLAAGRRAAEYRAQVHRRFADLLAISHRHAREQGEDVQALPDELLLALVGGINELVCGYLRDGRVAELPALEPAITELARRVLTGGPAGSSRASA